MREQHSLMKKLHKDQKGFSLMELLVAVAVGTIVIGLVAAFLSSGIRNFNRQSNSINLQNELQEANNAVTDALMEANTIKEITEFGQYKVELDTYTTTETEGGTTYYFKSENNYKCIFYNPENKSLYVLDDTGCQNMAAGKSIEAYAYSRYVTEFHIKSRDTMKDGTCIVTVHIKVQGTVGSEYLENDLQIATRNRIN